MIKQLMKWGGALALLVALGAPVAGQVVVGPHAVSLTTGADELGELLDVTLMTATSGQVLQYNGTAWVNATFSGGGASALNDLSDVTVSSPSTNQCLQYTGAGWQNSAIAYSEVTGTPSLATVATSGSYGDLVGAPALATVATSGDYGDLSNSPTLATVATSGEAANLIATGATDGQVLTASSGLAVWQDAAGGGGGSSSPGLNHYVVDEISHVPNATNGYGILVANTGTGAFVGQENKLAFYRDSAWTFVDPAALSPRESISVTVVDQGVTLVYSSSGSQWMVADGMGPTVLGTAGDEFMFPSITAGDWVYTTDSGGVGDFLSNEYQFARSDGSGNWMFVGCQYPCLFDNQAGGANTQTPGINIAESNVDFPIGIEPTTRIAQTDSFFYATAPVNTATWLEFTLPDDAIANNGSMLRMEIYIAVDNNSSGSFELALQFVINDRLNTETILLDTDNNDWFPSEGVHKLEFYVFVDGGSPSSANVKYGAVIPNWFPPSTPNEATGIDLSGSVDFRLKTENNGGLVQHRMILWTYEYLSGP